MIFWFDAPRLCGWRPFLLHFLQLQLFGLFCLFVCLKICSILFFLFLATANIYLLSQVALAITQWMMIRYEWALDLLSISFGQLRVIITVTFQFFLQTVFSGLLWMYTFERVIGSSATLTDCWMKRPQRLIDSFLAGADSQTLAASEVAAKGVK